MMGRPSFGVQYSSSDREGLEGAVKKELVK